MSKATSKDVFSVFRGRCDDLIQSIQGAPLDDMGKAELASLVAARFLEAACRQAQIAIPEERNIPVTTIARQVCDRMVAHIESVNARGQVG